MHNLLITTVVALAFAFSNAGASAEEPTKQITPQKHYALAKEQIRPLVKNLSGSFATDRIMVDGKKIGYMYREIADRPEDSGWRFFSGDEDQAYIDDLSHTAIYAVNTVANYDPDIIPYLDTPAPCAFEKIQGTSTYRRVRQ